MEAAKQGLMFYGSLPFYNKLFHDSGFEDEAASLLKGDGSGFVSEKMADELCLIGPPDRCRERLAAFQEAGIQMPIFNPSPVGGESYGDAVRSAIETFAQ